jgi:hypothetical protein
MNNYWFIDNQKVIQCLAQVWPGAVAEVVARQTAVGCSV